AGPGGARAGAARGAGRGDSADRRGGAPRGRVTRPRVGVPGHGRIGPSRRGPDRRGGNTGVPGHLQRPAQGLLRPDAPGWAGGEGGGADRDRTRRGAFAPADRKSTRLNSSHQINSYAVFCLKKKTRLSTRLETYLHRKK